jgi:hypothetical protein
MSQKQHKSNLFYASYVARGRKRLTPLANVLVAEPERLTPPANVLVAEPERLTPLRIIPLRFQLPPISTISDPDTYLNNITSPS